MSRYRDTPTERAIELLYEAARYAKATSGLTIKLRKPAGYGELNIVVYTDSSGVQSLNSYPQGGFIVLVNGSPLMWKSNRWKQVARSTAKAELLAMVDRVNYAE